MLNLKLGSHLSKYTPLRRKTQTPNTETDTYEDTQPLIAGKTYQAILLTHDKYVHNHKLRSLHKNGKELKIVYSTHYIMKSIIYINIDVIFQSLSSIHTYTQQRIDGWRNSDGEARTQCPISLSSRGATTLICATEFPREKHIKMILIWRQAIKYWLIQKIYLLWKLMSWLPVEDKADSTLWIALISKYLQRHNSSCGYWKNCSLTLADCVRKKGGEMKFTAR